MKVVSLEYKHILGFSLIEVMVALFILSIGALAFMQVQMMSLKLSSDAHYRTQAINIANEVATRIRVNKSELEIYSNNGHWSDENNLSEPCINTQESCSSQQLAKFDIWQIKNWLGTLLPNGQLGLYPCQVNNITPCYLISVSWLGAKADSVCLQDSECVQIKVVF